jgi:hypothetical protein
VSNRPAALVAFGARLAAAVAPRAAPVAPAPGAALAFAAAVFTIAALLAFRPGAALEGAVAAESLGIAAVAASPPVPPAVALAVTLAIPA